MELDVRYIPSLQEIRLYKPNGEYWCISTLRWNKEDRIALVNFLGDVRLQGEPHPAESEIDRLTEEFSWRTTLKKTPSSV